METVTSNRKSGTIPPLLNFFPDMYFNRYRKLRSALPFPAALFCLFLAFACSDGGDAEKAIVAKIGDAVITAEDFQRNYELGFGHLKTGQDGKRTYLEYMIKEALLAQEGFRLGYAENERVKQAEAALKSELMIEALLKKEVRGNITVSQDEIREAINKSKVSFKFRFWPETDLERAEIIAAEMRDRGYAEVVDDIVRQNPEVNINPRQFETNYLNWLQVQPQVLDAIKDLPYGEISDPVALNGRYFIYQVLDIRRDAVTENEYNDKASRYEQVIFYQKYEKALAVYMERLMEPKQIVVKKEAFPLLLAAFRAWERLDEEERAPFFTSVENANVQSGPLFDLKQVSDEPFMTSQEENMTVRDFLKIFNTSRAQKSENEQRELKTRLYEATQISIRDYFLTKEARQQQLDMAPDVQHELNLWRSKWIFQEINHVLIQDVEVSRQDAEMYFEQNKFRYRTASSQQPTFQECAEEAARDAGHQQQLMILNEKITELREQYPVWINEAVLDTVSVVDFEKSKWAGMQVFKAGTGRPAYPIVSGEWGISAAAAPEKKAP